VARAEKLVFIRGNLKQGQERSDEEVMLEFSLLTRKPFGVNKLKAGGLGAEPYMVGMWIYCTERNVGKHGKM
jgi:hypothetical protein